VWTGSFGSEYVSVLSSSKQGHEYLYSTKCDKFSGEVNNGWFVSKDSAPQRLVIHLLQTLKTSVRRWV
jgi:hypothetical protein